MKVKFVVNNYTLGSRVRSTPTDKIVEQNRIDKSHTEIIYDLSEREIAFCEKVLARKGIRL